MTDANSDDLRKKWSKSIPEPDAWESGDPTLTYKPGRSEAGTDTTLDSNAFLGSTNTVGPAPGDSQASGTATSDGSEYQLLEKIGEGGMGVIWRAHQKSLSREVAIKQSKTDPSDPAGAAAAGQFVAESRVTGFLDHPNIVPVHTLGKDAGGRLFLSMKLVQGTSWRDLIHPWTPDLRARAKHMDIESHLEILMSVCNAIAFAHSRNVAHLDLKPANVMIGDFGEVLVMDWGIAVDIGDRARKSTPSDDPRRTRHHTDVLAPAGTPAYIAPEMAQGRGQSVGTWTDVYLLGSILHEIITGEPPHKGESISAVLYDATRSGPKEYPPDTPSALVAICHKAMAADTRERYQSAAQFRADVASFLKYRESMQISERADRELAKLDGTDVRYRSEVKRYEVYADAVSRYRQALELWNGNEVAGEGLRKTIVAYCRAALAGGDLGLASAQLERLPWEDKDARGLRDLIESERRELARTEHANVRTRQAMKVLAALIFIGITIGFFWIRSERNTALLGEKEATAARQRAEGERREALRQREQADLEARKAQAVLEFMQRMLASARAEQQGKDVTVLELLDRTDEQIRTSFRKQPEIRATVQHTLGMTLLSLGKFERARAMLKLSLVTRTEKLGADHPEALESAYALSTAVLKLGKYNEAERMFREVLDSRASALGAEHRDTLKSAVGLASALTFRGKYAESEKLLSKTLVAQQTELGSAHSDTLDTMFRLTTALRCQGKTEEAGAVMQQILEAEREAFLAQNPGLFMTREAAPDALAVHRRLMESQGGLRSLLMGDRDKQESESYNSADNLARILKSLSKGDEAARTGRDIIAIRARLLGIDHPRTLDAIHGLGENLIDRENYAIATEVLHGVVHSAREILGDDHPDTLRFERSLAEALRASGEPKEARKLLHGTVKRLAAALGTRHPQCVLTKCLLANTLEDQADYAAAISVLLGIQQDLTPQELGQMPGVGDIAAMLSRLRRKAGDK